MPGEPPGSSDPLDPAGLVGRAAEAAAIRRMLDVAPLITVTGLPGVGKTAVSLAAALRLPDQYTRSRLDVLVDQLRDRHLLLILDTCGKLGVSSRVQLASWLRTRPPLNE